MGARIAAGMAVLLLFVPTAGAQTPVYACAHQCRPADADVNPEVPKRDGQVNVILFSHWQDVLNRAPMNTQGPIPGEEDLSGGILTPGIVTGTGTPADIYFYNYKFEMLPSSSRVEIRDGEWRTYQEPLPMDFLLGEGPIRLYVYFSADAATQTGVGPAGVAPLVYLEARWELGRIYGAGAVLAAGATTAFHMYAVPGQPPVYEVPIDLVPVTGAPFGRDDSVGSIMSIRILQVDEGDTEFVQTGWRMNVGPTYPWRLVLPVINPLESLGTASQITGDYGYVRWSLDSALGVHDIDPASFELLVQDANGVTLLQPDPFVVRYSFNHFASLEPVNVTWQVPRGVLEENPGGQFELRARNIAGTFELVRTASFPQGKSYDPAQSPGFEFLLIVGILGAAWGLRRRPETP